ncbi:unnamed protein product [Dracunculus medinensis]|uniref:Uncharacterized protein n=1 Tax=Dracunculus medinensis TaxID=318479 RepID=A0A0N4UMK4_DRAME|nr:unnamed protein product [Dracunculus medinensis]
MSLSRYETYTREQQNAFVNHLLATIYENYEATRRIQSVVEGIHRIVITILVLLVICISIGLIYIVVIGCRRYQAMNRQVLHRPKSEPIEI